MKGTFHVPFLLFTLLLAVAVVGCSTHPGGFSINDKPAKVLIIGDSISIGYTPHVAMELKNLAVIKHNPGNAQHTGVGLDNIDAWIGDNKWDIIHFNFGLWDMCYRKPGLVRDKADGQLTTTPEQYEKNLDQLVSRLKQTGASLIWANTTYVPDGETGRFAGDDIKYNAIAAKVMRKHDVAINDLHTLTANFPVLLFIEPANVHYTNDGYAIIAEQVSTAILNGLSEK